MLPQKYRLSRDEIDDVMRRGKSLKGRYLAIKYLNESSVKTAVVVSKKVSKGAIKRNKVKRNIREVVRRFIKEDEISNSHVVIMALPEALGVSTDDMSTDLMSILNRSTA